MFDTGQFPVFVCALYCLDNVVDKSVYTNRRFNAAREPNSVNFPTALST